MFWVVSFNFFFPCIFFLSFCVWYYYFFLSFSLLFFFLFCICVFARVRMCVCMCVRACAWLCVYTHYILVFRSKSEVVVMKRTIWQIKYICKDDENMKTNPSFFKNPSRGAALVDWLFVSLMDGNTEVATPPSSFRCQSDRQSDAQALACTV